MNNQLATALLSLLIAATPACIVGEYDDADFESDELVDEGDISPFAQTAERQLRSLGNVVLRGEISRKTFADGETVDLFAVKNCPADFRKCTSSKIVVASSDQEYALYPNITFYPADNSLVDGARVRCIRSPWARNREISLGCYIATPDPDDDRLLVSQKMGVKFVGTVTGSGTSARLNGKFVNR